jgi:hypothetical protein
MPLIRDSKSKVFGCQTAFSAKVLPSYCNPVSPMRPPFWPATPQEYPAGAVEPKEPA